MAYNNRVNPIPNNKQNDNKKGSKNMNIITSNKSLSKEDTYALLRGADVQNMTSAIGDTLVVDVWMLCKDGYVNDKGEPAERKVLYIRDTAGRTFVTVSPTFIDEFGLICEIFGKDLPPVLVISDVSKAGNEFITCILC